MNNALMNAILSMDAYSYNGETIIAYRGTDYL